MKIIYACTTCGSPRVYQEALIGLNYRKEIKRGTYHCMDCKTVCDIHEVLVDDGFGIEVDFYKEK